MMIKTPLQLQIDDISNYLVKNRVNLFVRDRLQEWMAGLRKLDRRPEVVDLNGDWLKISNFIKDYIQPLQRSNQQMRLEGTEEIFMMNLVGNLGRYLNGTPKKETIAEALYWLALAERSIYDSMYFSLSDLLLKTCVRSYSIQPFARKCLQEYEDQLIFSYTGSRGTEIPSEVADELRLLKEHFATPEQKKE